MANERALLARLRSAARRNGDITDPVRIVVDDVAWRVGVAFPAHAVEVAADLCGLGWTAYAPLGRRVIERARIAGPNKRGRKVVSYPVFGAYLFVAEDGPGPVCKSMHAKMIAILSDANGALRVSSSAVASINSAECEGRWDDTKRLPDRFHKGDPVRIAVGQFADFLAVVEDVERSGRIRIAAQIFGQATTIRVKPEQLEVA